MRQNSVSGPTGRLLASVAAVLLLSFAVRPALGQTPCGASLPCSFGIRGQQVAPVPATFRFQARLSQARLPVGDREVARVVVRLERGHETLCIEEFSEVRIDDSVLDLVLGHEISCDLDRVLAENHELVLQVCLGGTDNCLRPLVLGTSPYAVKASHAIRAQQAQQAAIATQANWVHRVTADRGTALHRRLRTGWFQFDTPGAAPRLFEGDGFLQYEDGGFLQWTPLQERNPTLHVSAKDHVTDTPVPLSKLVLAAERTQTTGAVEVESGGVHVRGVSDVVGTTIVRGQLKVERPAAGGPEGVRVRGETRLDGELAVSERLTVQSQGLAVTGDSEVDGDVAVRGDLRVQPEQVGDGWAARVEGTGAVGGVLQVGGAAKVTGGGLHVDGDVGVGGGLAVSERVTARDLTVGGTLTVLGRLVAPSVDPLPLLAPDGDADGDFVNNATDVCVFTPDPAQEDSDGDGRGDACDPDADGDRSPNDEDCLPYDGDVAGPDGRPDTTCDGVDDDCDGETDEEFVPGACDTGEQGICGEGLTQCVDMEPACIQQREPEADDAACDGLDSDCDGELDEDYEPVACNSGLPGICAPGETVCEDGGAQCVAGALPGQHEEVCDDDLDNDCDGEVDEECIAFVFAEWQRIGGYSVTCSRVTNTDTYTECFSMMVADHRAYSSVCGGDWRNGEPPALRGFCSFLGANGAVAWDPGCAGAAGPRFQWVGNQWARAPDAAGMVSSLRCYY